MARNLIAAVSARPARSPPSARRPYFHNSAFACFGNGRQEDLHGGATVRARSLSALALAVCSCLSVLFCLFCPPPLSLFLSLSLLFIHCSPFCLHFPVTFTSLFPVYLFVYLPISLFAYVCVCVTYPPTHLSRCGLSGCPCMRIFCPPLQSVWISIFMRVIHDMRKGIHYSTLCLIGT